MSLASDFIDRVLSADTASFTLEDRSLGKWYHFLQDASTPLAKFVYGSTGYDRRFFASLEYRPALVAIVAMNKVFVVDDYFFTRGRIAEEAGRAVRFADYVSSVNDHIQKDIFPVFYRGLKPTRSANESDCKKRARLALLAEDPENYTAGPKLDDLFTGEDVIRILCGFMTADLEAMSRLYKDEEKWTVLKADHDRTMKLIEAKHGVEDWELRIAEGLRSTDAVAVTVEFEKDGKTASGKIEPHKILSNLIDHHSFADFEFVTATQGKQIFATLGMDSWEKKTALKCDLISRIIYGKKVLYEK